MSRPTKCGAQPDHGRIASTACQCSRPSTWTMRAMPFARAPPLDAAFEHGAPEQLKVTPHEAPPLRFG